MKTRIRHLRTYLLNPIRDLADHGQRSGVLLLTATLFSLILSNTGNATGYLGFWHKSINISGFDHNVLFWINDGLMPLFFFLVGTEIKRELLDGELSSFRKAMLPVVAAVGGMLVPGLIFVVLNFRNPETIHGWAIPTATDIAFSLGILSLLGRRIPFSLKVFLTALAIIDDLGAIIIIALFYSHDLQLMMLLYGGIVFALLIVLNLFRVKNLIPYLLLGILLWYLILQSGIHPTIAGVLVAFSIPLKQAKHFENHLHTPVYYFILPFFALANTAIPLSLDVTGQIFSGLSLGVIVGLFLGKPAGIVLATYLMVKSRISHMLKDVSWMQMIGLGLTAGIGFTMSIFISTLSFSEDNYTNVSKLAIILGSLFSAAAGLLILKNTRISHEVQDN
ncbi:MAG: Na+/H+ antiporter NhaA [Syntrophothermus sp.]